MRIASIFGTWIDVYIDAAFILKGVLDTEHYQIYSFI